MTTLDLMEYGREFSKQVENTVGKAEIARYEQFLLFPHCFQKNFTADTFGKGLNYYWQRDKGNDTDCTLACEMYYVKPDLGWKK